MIPSRFVSLLMLLATASKSQVDYFNPFPDSVPVDLGSIGEDGSSVKSRTAGNLYDTTGSVALSKRDRATNKQLDMFFTFSYFGARYNYTIISENGYLAFGTVENEGKNIIFGREASRWPQQPDPALIAVYAMDQEVARERDVEVGAVKFKVVVSESHQRSSDFRKLQNARRRNPNRDYPGEEYLQVDQKLLERVANDLTDGMAGASNFVPTAALIVTWENMTFSGASDEEKKSKRGTYQAVLLTAGYGDDSYVVLNYAELGYTSSDVKGENRLGRVKTGFNGGNQTGSAWIDRRISTSLDLKQLAVLSAVPHQASGRYMFKVDEIVINGGCTNFTEDFPMLVYPSVVNMLGATIEINGPCFTEVKQFDVKILTEKAGKCYAVNAAKAVCTLPRNFHMGIRTMRLSSDINSGFVNCFQTVYYASPLHDPLGLRLPDISQWFEPLPKELKINWNPEAFVERPKDGVSSLPSTQLTLELHGFMEHPNKGPVFKHLMTFGTGVSSSVGSADVFTMSDATIEEKNVARPFRFGMLRLKGGSAASWRNNAADLPRDFHRAELWSKPIPIHWLWKASTPEQVAGWSGQECLRWFDGDGRKGNFIRFTETNASCPCREEQARVDFGRFMPHPRCHAEFKNLDCELYLGAFNCYLSAQNVMGPYTSTQGQVCCFDDTGYLMHTGYQSLVEAEDQAYSPGFPQRAYEFGTPRFYERFQVPSLSHYDNDLMPYFMCCKWAPDYCKFFYWRRPSSSCQNYEPGALASAFGSGHMMTFDGRNYTLSANGTFVLLHKPAMANRADGAWSPETMIQARMEQYPRRDVDFTNPNLDNEELVQPQLGNVITGLAITESDADTVLVMVRKDLRRLKYRTNIIIGGVLYWFDQVDLQRHKGVTVYIRRDREAQSEIYVVLEKSRIGLKIRESFTAMINLRSDLHESHGLLDVVVSVPPEHLRQKTPDFLRNDPNFAWDDARVYEEAVAGLLGTYTNDSSDELLSSDRQANGANRNFPTTRRGIHQYVPGDSFDQFVKSWLIDGVQFQTLFQSPNSDMYLNAEMMVAPTYPASQNMISEARLQPATLDLYTEVLGKCSMLSRTSDYVRLGVNGADFKCSVSGAMLDAVCLQDDLCKFDYLFLSLSDIATESDTMWDTVASDKDSGQSRYVSCGSINVEWPDSMMIQPSYGKTYLDGNAVKFACHPTHWMKGDSKYVCHNGHWNKGWQPWCRSRALEKTLRGLAIFFGIFVISSIIILVFIGCRWSRRKRKEQFKNSIKSRLINSQTSTPRPFENDRNKDLPPLKVIGGGSQLDLSWYDKPSPTNKNNITIRQPTATDDSKTAKYIPDLSEHDSYSDYSPTNRRFPRLDQKNQAMVVGYGTGPLEPIEASLPVQDTAGSGGSTKLKQTTC